MPLGQIESSQPQPVFTPVQSFAVNAVGIGIAVWLGIMVMRGVRK